MIPLSVRLRAARKALHPPVTQKEVAEKFDLTPGAVNLWEAGKTEPSATHLVELAKWFGVSIDWLLGLETSSPNIHRGGIKTNPPLFTVPVVHPLELSRWHWEAVAEILQTAIAYPVGTAAAMAVQSDALTSLVPTGSYAVVSKAHEPVAGQVVLASVDRASEPVIRRYIKEGRDALLVADDQRFPSYRLEQGVRIIGKVVEVVMRKTLFCRKKQQQFFAM